MNKKETALKTFLVNKNYLTSNEIEDVVFKKSTYEDSLYDVGLKNEFLVLTDEEADEKAKEYILDTLWAFDTHFLQSHTGVDSEIFKLLADKCESANEAILRMIKDEDEFVADAIVADGRGHFINSYDGEEHEVEDFYIYKT